MSTLSEITESKTTVFIKQKESFFLSVSRDLVTLAMVSLCVYISQDSKWWTFVTGLMFIFFIWVKLANMFKNSSTTFKTKEDAIEYLRAK